MWAAAKRLEGSPSGVSSKWKVLFSPPRIRRKRESAGRNPSGQVTVKKRWIPGWASISYAPPAPVRSTSSPLDTATPSIPFPAESTTVPLR